MTEILLTPRQFASEYGFTVEQLRNWRHAGAGPDFIKLSPGKGGRIKYKRSAIESWLNQRTVSPRSAA